MLLRVHDNGAGFVVRQTSRRRGLGLSTMRERAERTGGSCKVTSVPGEGTTVLASWSRAKIRAVADTMPEVPVGY